MRKELGDTASRANYIKTIPKQGYLLTAKVEAVVVQRKCFWLVASLVMAFMGLVAYSWLSQQQTVLEQLQESIADAERLTAKPGMEQQAILSDDGQWLSFSRNSAQESLIFIQSLLSNSQTHTIALVRHRLSSPVYLPESDELLVAVRDQHNCYLKKYDLKQAEFTDLAKCEYQNESRTVNYHEAENLILFAASTNTTTAIYQMSKGQRNKKQLTFPSVNHDWDPHISPDGHWLSFSRGNHSVRNIWLKKRSDGEAFALTEGAHYSVSHSWYDDEHIVFDSDINGSRQLWLVNIYDKKPQLIGAYGAQHPSFDANKKVMTYQEVSYEANIWLLDRLSKSFKRVIHSTKYDNNPAFSPDGNAMVYSSNRQDMGSIWHYDFKNQTDALVLSIEGAKLTRPFWHKNGKQVLITRNDDFGYSTLSYDLTTEKYETLAFGEPNLSAQAIKNTYFALSKAPQHNNQIIKLFHGQIEVLPIKRISRFMLVDENTVIYTKIDTDGLYVFDMQNEVEKNVIPDFNKNAINLWTAVNQAIYFDQSGEKAGLWRYDLRDDRYELISEHRPFSVGASMSVNQAETQILITQTDRAESDIFKVKLQ